MMQKLVEQAKLLLRGKISNTEGTPASTEVWTTPITHSPTDLTESYQLFPGHTLPQLKASRPGREGVLTQVGVSYLNC